MALKELFKDNNDINEKSVVGFASFVIMVIFALADLITGYVGKDLDQTIKTNYNADKTKRNNCT